MRLLTTIISSIFLFCIGYTNASAQAVDIKKSNEQEVISGKIFYVHHVKKGETLYSISKTYAVPSSLIIECNAKSNFSLSIGETLRIPMSFDNDDRYIYHCLQKGETLFSLYKRTGVPVEEILRHNPEILDISDIAIGAYIKIPKRAITDSEYLANKVEKNSKIEKSVDSIHDVSVNRNKESILAKKTNNNDGIVNIDENVKTNKNINDSIVNRNLNIAVFLPFYLNNNDLINKPSNEENAINEFDLNVESEKNIDYKKIYPKSETFIKFYQGFLLACDSLKNEGFNITINTFDTEKNKDTVKKIIDKLDFSKYDFIVGPPYSSTFHIAAEKAMAERTPIISPLSDYTKTTEQNPYVFQLNTSERTVIKSTANYVYKNFKKLNIVVVYPKNYQHTPEAELVSCLEDSLYNCNKYIEYTDIHYTKISFDKYSFFGIKQVLKHGVENIVIVPSNDKSDVYSIIPTINALTDSFRISLIALPAWQRFDSLDPATFYNLNTRMLIPYYIDYNDINTIQFVDKFRNKYSAEPNDFSFRAYDLANYFIRSAARGNIKNAVFNNSHTNQLQSCFKFVKDSEMLGKENKGLHLIHYKRDYTIEKQSIN